jgi:hypothetical protein
VRDLRAIKARITLVVYSIAPIRGINPPSVLLVGENLDRAETVEINGITAEEFSVMAVNRLAVRIPTSQIGQAIYSIRVFAEAASITGDAVFSFSFSRPVRDISGMDRLVQQWLLIFMSTPGSDIFDTTSGGGGRALVGAPVDVERDSISADLALAVTRTNNELLSKQSSVLGLPPEERLLSSALESVSFDKNTTTLYGRVSIQNMVGQSADLSLG